MADEVVEMLREAAREALPPMDGELKAGGLRGPVEVRRDRWGIPHISASNLHDLFFAQGFVVASDRYFQIELLMRYSSGRLSELIGAGKSTHPARSALLTHAHLPTSGQGSNEWVVAGERSATGKPLLANDPHLAILLPAMWYECDLAAPGFHAAGASLPFAPGIVIGHNERIAWGVTDTESDVSDLYLERLSGDGTSVEYRGAWEPLTARTETSTIRHGDDVVLYV